MTLRAPEHRDRLVRSVAGLLALGCAGVLAVPVWDARGGATSAQTGAMTFEVGRFMGVGGPRLAGGDVVWTEPDPANGGYRLVRGLADGSTQEFARLEGPGRRFDANPVVAASESQVFVRQLFTSPQTREPEFFEFGGVPDGATVRVVGGALEPVGPAGYRIRSPGVDVSGEVAIFPAANALRATIRNFGSPSTPDRTVEGVEGPVSIAGRYAAWAEARDVVVYDWQAGTEAYRVRGVVSESLSSFDIESVDIQADGKVAFVYPVVVDESVPSRVGWASLDEPFLHPVRLREGPSYFVRLAGDTIAFARGPGFPTARAELGVVGLFGGERTLVSPVEQEFFGVLFDFDGARLTWQTRTCDGARVSVATVADLTARPQLAQLERCPLVVYGRPRVTRRGHVALRLDCTGFNASECFHRGLRIRTARTERLGGRRVRKGTSIGFRFSPVQRAVARVRLNRLGRRLARKRGPLRVTVLIIRGDDTLQQRRRTTLALR